MRLSEEELQKRREGIIQTAFLLFCEKGIEAVRLTEIARKSHVSEATIYRYFGNKEQLVLEAFVKLWDNIMRNVYQIVIGMPDYEAMTGYEQMRAWLDGFCHLYQKDGDFVLFSYEAKMYLLRHDIRMDKMHQDVLMHSWRTSCLDALEKGKKDGSMPVEADGEDLFYAIWGTIRGYVAKIVIYDKLYEGDSPWENRYETVKNGILCALRAGWRPDGE